MPGSSVDIQAFDNVNQSVILEKLTQNGFGGNCHKLMQSYLNNRRQTLRIEDTISRGQY